MNSELSIISIAVVILGWHIWKCKGTGEHIISLLNERFVLCKHFFSCVVFFFSIFSENFSLLMIPCWVSGKEFLTGGTLHLCWRVASLQKQKKSDFINCFHHLFLLKDSSRFVDKEGLNKTYVGRSSFIPVEKHASYIFIL